MGEEHVILLPRAYYSAPIITFLGSTPETVLGTLTTNSQMAVDPPQRDAWLQEIAILKAALQGLDGTLFLEFNIPRMGKRIDAVVVSGAVVFVIEFKVGEKHFARADLDQVWDYALDLKNFHEASHAVPILPILVVFLYSIVPVLGEPGPPAYALFQVSRSSGKDGSIRGSLTAESGFNPLSLRSLRSLW